MSGGSFSYLYNAVARDDLYTSYVREELNNMADWLLLKGYEDIRRDVLALKEYLIFSKAEAENMYNKLEEVFHAIKWYVSADYDDDDLSKAIEKYREGEKK